MGDTSYYGIIKVTGGIAYDCSISSLIFDGLRKQIVLLCKENIA